MVDVKTIDSKTLHQWIEDDKVIVIDVREQEEYNEEHIPASHLYPLSSFEPECIPDFQGKILVFHCRSGMRSHRACQNFLESFPDQEIYNLEGGILAWKNAGYPTKP